MAESDQLATFKIKYKGPVPGSVNLSQKSFNRIVRSAWEYVGRWWHERIREKHFTKDGGREYGYTPRSGEQAGLGSKMFFRSYAGRKQKMKGHQNPLVFSGEARDRLSKMARISATATAKGSTLKIAYPMLSKLNFRGQRRGGAQSPVDMHAEFTALSRDDLEKATILLNQYMDVRLQAVRDTAERQAKG